jgi:predicted  nucleic acid-binding Zn-ribbon protein
MDMSAAAIDALLAEIKSLREQQFGWAEQMQDLNTLMEDADDKISALEDAVELLKSRSSDE